MKYCYVSLSCLLLSVTAFAATAPVSVQPACPDAIQQCMLPELAARQSSASGFVVEIGQSGGAQLATVEQLTLSRDQNTRIYRRLAELPCKSLGVKPNPDEVVMVAVCDNPEIVDAGFTVEILSPDFAGVQRVHVIEHSFAGSIDHGRLPCLR